MKQDPRLAAKFSGVMLPPVPLETRDHWLANAGLNRRWGDACQDASHALQRYYQKQGLEAARMDPACDGYDFWTIVDVVVKQGNTYSAQGFLNPFWEPKSKGYTPGSSVPSMPPPCYYSKRSQSSALRFRVTGCWLISGSRTLARNL